MSAEVSASTVLLVGVMLVRIVVSDVYQRYVRAAMGPWLLVAGVLLVTLGLVMVVRALRPAPADTPDHVHPHPGGERAGWLLLAPVLALLLVAPPALGSYGVDRAGVVRVGQGAAVWTPLPAGGPPRAMTVLELNERAWDRRGASLATASVRLTGFVVAPTTSSTSLRLARYQIACCAADAVPSVAHVTGLSGSVPAPDSWITVVGRFTGTAPDGLPIVEASSIQPVPTPVDPYE